MYDVIFTNFEAKISMIVVDMIITFCSRQGMLWYALGNILDDDQIIDQEIRGFPAFNHTQ